MVDIVGINTTPNQPTRVTDRSVTKSSVSKTKESSSPVKEDRIEISTDAKEAQSLNRLVAAAQAEPEVRVDAVARAKEKLDSGEFSGVEVSRQAAKNILGVK